MQRLAYLEGGGHQPEVAFRLRKVRTYFTFFTFLAVPTTQSTDQCIALAACISIFVSNSISILNNNNSTVLRTCHVLPQAGGGG